MNEDNGVRLYRVLNSLWKLYLLDNTPSVVLLSAPENRPHESEAAMWLVEPVAQLVEQEPFKLLAAGSSPARLIANISTAGVHWVPENQGE